MSTAPRAPICELLVAFGEFQAAVAESDRLGELTAGELITREAYAAALERFTQTHRPQAQEAA